MVLQQMCGGSKWCINFSCESSWWKEGSFYWLTGKGQSGGTAPPPGLRRWSDISCEEIKTRHLNGANGERGPSCTIGRRRRKKKKTEGALSETRVTEGSSLTFCLSFSSFPTWFVLRSTCGRQLKGSFTKTIISYFPQILFFFFFNCALQGLSIKPVF